MPADNKDKVTILKLQKQKKNTVKTVGVTAYDYPQALMADMLVWIGFWLEIH